jgi:hypothetical protein
MDSPPADGGTVLRRHDGELLRRLTTLRSDESFHFVFSNRTHSDPYAVSLHTELTKRGLRVWQQRMNIPKDSDNWFSEWYPAAAQARKIICFLTAAYMKSPFCMKEWRVAESKHKLLVVVLEPMEQLRGVNPAEYPHASNALAYLDGGGQVIFHDTDDVVLEILKFTDAGCAELVPEPAPDSPVCEPEPTAQEDEGAWPAELRELVGLPAVGARLREIGIGSLADFAENFDVDEGHDAELRAVRARGFSAE